MEPRQVNEGHRAPWGRVHGLAAGAWERVRAGWWGLRRALAERRGLRLGLVVALAAGGALALTGGVAWQTCGFAGCPDAARLAAYRPGGAPLLLDRQGQVIATLAPDDLPEVRLASLPPHLADAFVAIEDRRFLEHGAVDWRRVAGALAANLRAGGVEQGFSTISMQLARNLFPQEIPGQERTATRKLLEIRVAQQLEARFSKPEILELYLNHIYFGNGARGVEAAAWQYFRQPAARLTLAQAALLAAMPKAPSRYDPRRHPDRALARRNLVLARMAAQGRVAPELAAAATREPLGVRAAPERPRAQPTVARYFVEEVRHELDERFGGSLYTAPVRVWTTLDLAAQRAAEEELDRQLRSIESSRLGRAARSRAGSRGAAEKEGEGTGSDQQLEGAVVALEAASGDVLAWVGGRDYAASQFDRVTRAQRQAGSAWKPFVYAAALARGYPLSQPIADTPLVVPIAGGGTWEPRNYDNSFDGRVTMRDALVRSKNVPTVRLAQAVGYDSIAALARSDGITAPVPLLPSMPLGTVSVSPLELTAAYTAFASLGWQAAPRVLLRVERADGTVLWTAPEPRRRQVLDPAVAYLLDDALREAIARGSGAPGLPPGFAGHAAGKTGTSSGGNDLWFIGFTPAVVAGVWIGYDEPRPVADQATGGRLAAPVFKRLMSRLYAGRAVPQWWQMPPGITTLPIDPASGLAISEGCVPAGGAPAARELFLAGREPNAACPGVGTAALEGMAEAASPSAGGGEEGGMGTGMAGEPEAEPGSGDVAGPDRADRGVVARMPAPAAAAPTAAPGATGGETDRPDVAAEAAGPDAGAPSGGGTPGGGTSGGSPRSGAPGQARPPGMVGAGGDGGLPGARAPGGVAEPPGNLSGWWEVSNTFDAASAGQDGSMRVTYRIALRQEGTRITGEGERWAEDGRPLPAALRAPIDLAGTVDGREVRLRFVERGSRHASRGTWLWRLSGGGEDLAGTFVSSGADAHGASAAVRLR